MSESLSDAVREAAFDSIEGRYPETMLGHRQLRQAYSNGAVWVAGRLPSRDEIGSVIHEKFNDCRGRGGVDPYRLADEVLALIREHVTKEDNDNT